MRRRREAIALRLGALVALSLPVYPGSAAALGPAASPVPRDSSSEAGPKDRSSKPAPKDSPAAAPATSAAPPASPTGTADPAAPVAQESPLPPPEPADAAAPTDARPRPPTRTKPQGPYRGADAEGAQRTRESLGLVRQDDGSYFYVDSYKRFTASFNPDGTVTFADRWRRPDRRDSQHGKCCGLPRGLFGPMGLSVTGPTEWIMALEGEDRDGRVKAELLQETREMRTQMAIAWNLAILSRRLGELERELMAIWTRKDMTPAARRDLLFRRWDECDESFQLGVGEVPEEALSTIDAARIDTAEKARATIERFVREHLPRGSAAAYRTAELDALNARRMSRRPFEPYRTRSR